MKKLSVVTFVTAGVAFIVALIPLHAFLTVWAANIVGHYTTMRLWKEFLLIPLTLAALWMAWRRQTLRQQLLGSWLFRCIVAYILVTLLLGIVALKQHEVNKSALAEGLIIDLRLVIIFFVAWVAASYSSWLKAHWCSLVLIPAAIVVIFGLLQAFVLPADFLAHFGYTAATIQPFQTVDQNLQFIRIQSTLRGSDPLGAYLVVIAAAIAALYLQLVTRGKRLWYKDRKAILLLIFGVGTAAALYCTYSRSAYVGAALAVALVIWLRLPSAAIRRWLLLVAVALCVLFGGAVLAFRHNTTFEDTFFHTSQLSHSSQSSNYNHTVALKSGVHDVIYEPLGRGPGTAGPASVHNSHPARIAENFFLQIGQEIGWLGLGLFLAINILISKLLWERRNEKDQLAVVLFATLVGLSFVNLLLHAWADDTLAYLWWGLAGVAVGQVPLRESKASKKA